MAETLTGEVPRRCDMTSVSTTITPIEATARATAGAVRSGRKIRPYSTSPSSPLSASAAASAAMNGQWPPTPTVSGVPGMRSSSLPCRRKAYSYAPNRAIAPVAKLMTPELR